jgi:hypothetical protein
VLVPSALDGVKKIDKVWTTETEVVYHFALIEAGSRVTHETVKRGDAIDRFFLRILRMKTERVVERNECVQNPIPPNRIDMSKIPVEVWVYGSVPCLMPDRSQIASR